MPQRLSSNELERYDRQLMIFGKKGQRKLKSTKVFISGAGGLGCTVSAFLGAAGIGKLRIVDPDKIATSNLNRHILFGDSDVGKNKAKNLERALKKINPKIEVEGISKKITYETIGELVSGCDLLVDCMDNFPSRYILNNASLEKKLPLFHAAVEGMRGQATTILPGKTPCLRCIFPKPPPREKFPIFGATAGLLATIQAHEVIKYVLGIGKLLTNKLLICSKGTEFEKLQVKKDPACSECSN